MLRLVLASNNAKKLAELRVLLAELPLQLLPQSELGIAEAEEPHDSFVENALAKARHAAQSSGMAALADDSGLCLPALGGEPGVHSAVYAGVLPAQPDREAQRRAQDAANNALLLEHLAGQIDRRAWFVSTVVAVRHARDPEPLIATARWAGEIPSAPSGSGGFGYDPLMWIPTLGATVAELPAEAKNRFSHRAQAMALMREQLRSLWL